MSIQRVEFSAKAGVSLHYYTDGRIVGFQHYSQTLDEAEERIARHQRTGIGADDFVCSSKQDTDEVKSEYTDWEVIYGE